jgi:hypothetical protein
MDMITLTTPTAINSVLGGNAPVAYNKLVLAPFTMDGVNQTISGTVRLTSTTSTTMQPINGTFRISVPLAELTIEVPQLDFYRRITLTSPQNTAVLNQIEAALAQVENGLISLGVIAGTRTAGV